MSFSLLNITYDDKVSPKISPDGTKILWMQAPTSTWTPYTLWVANITNAVVAYQRLRVPQSVPFEYQIYTSNGSNVHTKFTGLGTQLTTDDVAHAYWHPNSTKIIFVSDSATRSKIETINADGTGRTVIYNSPGTREYYYPQYNYDGTKIAYIDDTGADLYSANADGTNIVQLNAHYITSGGFNSFGWANAVNKIAFVSNAAHVINSDGTSDVYLNGDQISGFSQYAWTADDLNVISIRAGGQLVKMPVSGAARTDLTGFSWGAINYAGNPQIRNSRIYVLQSLLPYVYNSLQSMDLTGADLREEVATGTTVSLMSEYNY